MGLILTLQIHLRDGDIGSALYKLKRHGISTDSLGNVANLNSITKISANVLIIDISWKLMIVN